MFASSAQLVSRLGSQPSQKAAKHHVTDTPHRGTTQVNDLPKVAAGRPGSPGISWLFRFPAPLLGRASPGRELNPRSFDSETDSLPTEVTQPTEISEILQCSLLFTRNLPLA